MRTLSIDNLISPVEPLNAPFDREGLEDIGYMTCMTLVLLGNYAQTGHFGGPLAYTPYNVAAHLAGPELGGMRYDYRRPKHPFGDKFMLAGGHNVPTGYALWMIMGQALERKFKADRRQALLRRSQDRHPAHRRAGIPPRRGRAAKRCSKIMASPIILCSRRPKCAGIKALAGHAESSRCHQRRERRAFGRRHRHRGRQGRVLGYGRRAQFTQRSSRSKANSP